MGCEYYGKYGVPNLSQIFYEDDILSQWEGGVCVCGGGGGGGGGDAVDWISDIPCTLYNILTHSPR